MLTDVIRTFVEGLPGTLKEKRGIYSLEVVVAERKAFLSKKKLTYSAKFRIDDESHELRFTEMLAEAGSGVSAGDSGFGFKKETYKTGFGAREGTIDEQSNLLGKQYAYTFDFKMVRAFVENAAVQAGYAFKYQLTARGL